jgi:hypothetical protein
MEETVTRLGGRWSTLLNLSELDVLIYWNTADV